MAALMLGIDFSKTDMQISLWNEERTRAELYNFNGTPVGETIPMMVIADETGNLLTAREALEYSVQTGKQGVTSLYGNLSTEPVELEKGCYTISQLFAVYLQSVIGMVRKRYGGAPVAKIGITGERMTEERKKHIIQVMKTIGYTEEQLFFSTHADAFLWYELYERVGNGNAMTMDFDNRGMIAYMIHPEDVKSNTPYYVETTDYTELMPGSISSMREMEERVRCFDNVADVALARKQIETLYVTGDFLDSQEINRSLQNLSEDNRRVFAGRGLYCLGACRQAVKEKWPKGVIGDRKVFHTVFIEAYEDAEEKPVLLLAAGTALTEAAAAVQLILDETDELKFQIEDVRTRETMQCTVKPEGLRIRENKTIRLEVRVMFLDYETLVIKVRDIGFGEIYPATYRVWEQLIHLT